MTPEYGEDAPEREIKGARPRGSRAGVPRSGRQRGACPRPGLCTVRSSHHRGPGCTTASRWPLGTRGVSGRSRRAAAREHASARQRVTSASEISAVARRAGSEVAPGAGRARPAPDEGPHLGPPRRHPCGRGLRQGLGRVSVAGLVCLRPDARGRLFYRVRIHRRRTGERRGMSEADYAGLMAAAHH
jgi:hypothetical protein